MLYNLFSVLVSMFNTGNGDEGWQRVSRILRATLPRMKRFSESSVMLFLAHFADENLMSRRRSGMKGLYVFSVSESGLVLLLIQTCWKVLLRFSNVRLCFVPGPHQVPLPSGPRSRIRHVLPRLLLRRSHSGVTRRLDQSLSSVSGLTVYMCVSRPTIGIDVHTIRYRPIVKNRR